MRIVSSANAADTADRGSHPNAHLSPAPRALTNPPGTFASSPSVVVERRAHLEHELDRVQSCVQAEQSSFTQHMNWLMLSQALFLNAYLIVLVLGWSTPLPAKRWLLAGMAGFGVLLAVLIYVALRGRGEALFTLRRRRKDIETNLHKEYGRALLFTGPGLLSRGMSAMALGLLPVTFIAGWVALTLYTLAAPLNATAATAASAPNEVQTTAPAQRAALRAPALRGAAPARAGQPVQETVVAPVEETAATEPAAPPKRYGFKW